MHAGVHALAFPLFIRCLSASGGGTPLLPTEIRAQLVKRSNEELPNDVQVANVAEEYFASPQRDLIGHKTYIYFIRQGEGRNPYLDTSLYENGSHPPSFPTNTGRFHCTNKDIVHAFTYYQPPLRNIKAMETAIQ